MTPAGDEQRWRLFFALAVSEQEQQQLWRQLGPLRARFPAARWLAAETYHLTLLFMGDTPKDRVAALGHKLAAFATDPMVRPCVLRLASGGGRRGVAWLEPTAAGARCAAIAAERLAAVVGPRTGSAPVPLRAHVTIARRAPEKLLQALRADAPEPAVNWLADRVVLYRSHLDASGPRYEELLSAGLADRFTDRRDGAERSTAASETAC
ncbi:MAG: RNA 2',3'-cyclic phosphodiesterase [Chloroflexi bacterium]|nr:RNA 2',3'-cyclic phosphodiesterase [Chloroflexota bacterium]